MATIEYRRNLIMFSLSSLRSALLPQRAPRWLTSLSQIGVSASTVASYLSHDNGELQPQMLEEGNCNKRMASAAESPAFPFAAPA
jgi:hypothetical protein